MALMKSISGMSPASKSGAAAGGAGGVLAILGAVTGAWIYVLYVAITLVIVAALVLAFRWFLKMRQKGRSNPFVGKLLGTASGAPASADPAMRARIDDLRKRFEEGIEKFRGAGKDVYVLPWVLMAGPSGSGKTEAVRHCNVGFPPGLQDPLQGTGGTLNMNWWFTNHAVILDTAGKMFMEEGGHEWKELMKLLKTWRPLQPVNGLILAIAVDSLIKDSADKIESEAAKVARQLDAITRELDVRFPVYVLVTKCDLLTGFREFFGSISDPQLQHQMLGWSNPADLDEQFQPDRVTEHLDQVCRRLNRRRGGLLADPTPQNMQEMNPRRVDEVDALYALPESLTRIGSRLRRYLELIFVQGEWSAKPLFLRGIYFTSSMQEGKDLDEAIAQALGVSVDALGGGGSFRVDKSYFLRDTLMNKVFPEKGLVTRATNVKQQQRGRKLIAIGTGIGVVALAIVFTLLGYFDLRGKVLRPAQVWQGVASHLENAPADNVGVFITAGPGKVAVNDKEDIAIETSAKDLSRAGLLTETAELSQTPVRVPLMFRAIATLSPSLTDNSRRAHGAVADLSVVRPLVKASRERFSGSEEIDWAAGDDAAVKTFASLLGIERAIGGGGKYEPKTSFPIESYLKLTSTPDEIKKIASLQTLQKSVDQAFAEGPSTWPPEGVAGKSDVLAIQKAAASFNDHWPKRLASDPQIGTLVTLRGRLEAFDAADQALATLVSQQDGKMPADSAAYETFRKKWDEQYKVMAESWEGVQKELGGVSLADVSSRVAKAAEGMKSTVDQHYRLVLNMPATKLDAAASAIADKAADKAAEKAGGKLDAAAKAADALGLTDPFRSDLPALKPILQSLKDRWDSLLKPDGDLSVAYTGLATFYSPDGRGGALLASASGDGGIDRVIKARFEAYKQVNDFFAMPAPDVAWGAVKTDPSQASSAASLGDTIAGVKDELERRVTRIGQLAATARDADDAPKSGSKGSIRTTASFAAQVAALGRRTAAVDSALAARRGSDEGWVLDRVKDVASQIEAASKASPSNPQPFPNELELPAPVNPNRLVVSREFDPLASRRVFDDFAALEKLVPTGPDQAAAASVLDARSKTAAALEVRESVRLFAVRFTQQWTSGVLARLRTIDAPDWRTMRQTIAQQVAVDTGIGRRLETIAGSMISALESVPASFDAASSGPKIKDWTDALRRDQANLKADTALRWSQSAGRWGTLPENPAEAVKQLAVLDVPRFQRDYLDTFSPDSSDPAKPGGPGAVYWDGVRLSALKSLVDAAAGKRSALLNNLDGLRKLPLSMEPIEPGGPVGYLSPAEVREVADGLVGLSPGPGGAGAGNTLASGEKTRIFAVDDQLGRLFGQTNILNDPRGKKLVAVWESWINAIAGEDPPKFTISVLPSSESNVPAPEADRAGYRNGFGTLRTIGVATDRDALKTLNDVDAGRTLIESRAITGVAKLRLEFFKDQEGVAVARSGAKPDSYGLRELNTPWSVLELLTDPDAKPIGDGTRRWAVPVRFNGISAGQATKFYMWVGIEFNRDLRPKADWPGPDRWR